MAAAVVGQAQEFRKDALLDHTRAAASRRRD